MMIPTERSHTPHTYSRRTVLKGAAIGAGGVAIAGAGGAGIRGGVNGVWNAGKGEPYELWDTWQTQPGHAAIVAAGVLAANPHNTQPWIFSIDGDTIAISPDDSRAMPATDTDSREHLAGLGCAVQNMAVAARGMSLDATVQTWPAPTVAASIALTPGAAPTDRELALIAAISERHTHRGPFSSKGLSADELARLDDADTRGASGPGALTDAASVRWVTDPAAVASLGELYIDATRAIIDDEQMSVEGFSWFRSTRSSIERHRDGLTLDCQGLSTFMLAAAKILPATSRTKGDAFWLKSTRDVHTATAAAYGVIEVSDASDPAARVNGGRLLENIHVAATADGLALQHMNQVSERITRDTALRTNDVFSKRWESLVGLPMSRSLVAFRIGHPDGTARRSPRRRLDSVLSGA